VIVGVDGNGLDIGNYLPIGGPIGKRPARYTVDCTVDMVVACALVENVEAGVLVEKVGACALVGKVEAVVVVGALVENVGAVVVVFDVVTGVLDL
jgi:hypothetical protein